MSGIHFSSPLHAAASALGVFHGPDHGRGGTPARSAPTVSLLLSGGFHAAALTLFLVLSARAPEEIVPTMKIRLFPQPPPIALEMPPRVNSGERFRPPSTDGTIEPVPPDEPTIETLSATGLVEPVPGAPRGESGKLPQDGSTEKGLPGPTVAPDPHVITPYDEAPVPLYHPDPVYPTIAKEAGVEGLVQLEAIVTSEGAVREVVVKEGNVMLADAARKAVLGWKFRPGKRKGFPITTRVAIPVRFILRD